MRERGSEGTHLAFVIRRRITFIVDPDIFKLVHRPADRRSVHVLVPRALHPVTDDGDPVGVVAREPAGRTAEGAASERENGGLKEPGLVLTL